MLTRYAIYDPKSKKYSFFNTSRKVLEKYLKDQQSLGLNFTPKDGEYYTYWKKIRDQAARSIIKKFYCKEVQE